MISPWRRRASLTRARPAASASHCVRRVRGASRRGADPRPCAGPTRRTDASAARCGRRPSSRRSPRILPGADTENETPSKRLDASARSLGAQRPRASKRTQAGRPARAAGTGRRARGRPCRGSARRRPACARRARVRHRRPVAQDRSHEIGDLEDLLVEAMGDVHDPDPVAAERPPPASSMNPARLRLSASAAVGSSMISTEPSCSRRLGDLDQLALARAQPLDGHVRVDVEAEACPATRARRAAPRPQSTRPLRLSGRSPRRTFSATLSAGTSASSWEMAAIPAPLGVLPTPRELGGRAVDQRARPRSCRARGRPDRSLISVDLPAPFSPAQRVDFPRAHVEAHVLQRDTTPGKRLVTPRASSSGAVMGAWACWSAGHALVDVFVGW